MNKLIWNVFIDDFNSGKIKIHNVFNHHGFMKDLVEDKKRSKDDFEMFIEQVRRSLMYHYWSKSEWEVVVTSFPPYINNDELTRLNDEREERIKKLGRFVRASVNLDAAEKIDVYQQVIINWSQFINYLWNNRNLIKVSEKQCK